MNRFFQAALAVGHIDVLMVCDFIDRSKFKGFSNLLAWAGRGLGMPLFTELALEGVLMHRMPSESTGICVTKETKHAPWLPDEFVNHLGGVES